MEIEVLVEILVVGRRGRTFKTDIINRHDVRLYNTLNVELIFLVKTGISGEDKAMCVFHVRVFLRFPALVSNSSQT